MPHISRSLNALGREKKNNLISRKLKMFISIGGFYAGLRVNPVYYTFFVEASNQKNLIYNTIWTPVCGVFGAKSEIDTWTKQSI